MPYNHSLIPAALLLILPTCGALHAQEETAPETLYVSDQVTLKMYRDSKLSQALPPLEPGDQVQILRRDDNYAEIKLADGTQGWVRSNRLMADKPAVVEMAELRQKLDSLQSEYDNLLVQIAEAANDPEPVRRMEAAEAARDKLQKRTAELETENARQFQELEGLRHMLDIYKYRDILIWAIAPLLALLVGFLIGYKYLDAKIRARFGGHSPV